MLWPPQRVTLSKLLTEDNLLRPRQLTSNIRQFQLIEAIRSFHLETRELDKTTLSFLCLPLASTSLAYRKADTRLGVTSDSSRRSLSRLTTLRKRVAQN